MKTPRTRLKLLLIVLTGILVVVAAKGIALYSKSVRQANEFALKQDLLSIREALDRYHEDRNTYPTKLEALVSERYLRAIPTDPFTRSSDSWQITRSRSEPGVADVRSGSGSTALDGSTYANW